MAYTCAVKACSNSTRKLKKWGAEECDIHECVRSSDGCSCEKPFRLIPFPTKKKSPEARDMWIKLVNRRSSWKSNDLWDPSKDSRVCSKHFIDGEPTEQHPYPTIKMGYDAEKRVTLFSPPTGKRKTTFRRLYNVPISKKKRLKISNTISSDKQFAESTTAAEDPPIPEQFPENNTAAEYPPIPEPFIFNENDPHETSFSADVDDRTYFNSNEINLVNLGFAVILLIAYIKILLQQIANLEKLAKSQESIVKEDLCESLVKSDKECLFYTNIDSLQLFDKLHENIAPLIKRRAEHEAPQGKREFVQTPKKFGPPTKLSSRDEFLLTLMKLKLGLVTTDLAQRFGISGGLCTQIFFSWLRGMAEYLRSFVYMPDLETILSTTPKRFRGFNNLMGIIDCSEVFIETPKNLELQSATWSEYKHHNTVKFLVCVAPNSAISFISRAYTGRISDKQLTVSSNFLDFLPSFCSIMADKGFNLIEECTARNIYFIVPPGRRGTSQMSQSDVQLTSKIAKVRILVEQVIRRLKTFKILAQEVPISLLGNIDDILLVCSALCNFKKPLYDD